MQLDELLDLLGAPITERKALESGFDPWVVSSGGYEDYHKAKYQADLENHGTLRVCVICGNEWRVHPTNARKALACSKSCSMKRYRQRRKAGVPPQGVSSRFWESSPNGIKAQRKEPG